MEDMTLVVLEKVDQLLGVPDRLVLEPGSTYENTAGDPLDGYMDEAAVILAEGGSCRMCLLGAIWLAEHLLGVLAYNHDAERALIRATDRGCCTAIVEQGYDAVRAAITGAVATASANTVTETKE